MRDGFHEAWTLVALGVTVVFSAVLSPRGLRSLWRKRISRS